MMPHTCHALGCDTPIPARLFMCAKHWRLVPKPMQRAIWQAYEPDQEVTKEPSPAYLAAAKAAKAAVARREREMP